MNYRRFQAPEVAARVYQLFNGVYRTGTPSQGEWEVIHEDGSRVQIEGTVELVKGMDGKPASFRGMVRDITERKRAQERIQYLATHDELTGLPNRDVQPPAQCRYSDGAPLRAQIRGVVHRSRSVQDNPLLSRKCRPPRPTWACVL